MKRQLVHLLLVIALVFVGVTFAPARAEALDTSGVDKFVNDMMTLYGIPGAAVALVQDGKVVYTKGYGYRNAETKDPVTENTLFQVGSVTKSFTALTILELVHQGKLDLDKPIADYLPDLKLATPELPKKLTLRYLLTMSSGLPRDDLGWYLGNLKARQEVIDAMVKIQPTADVGKVWQYCNQNFVLAAYVLEKITGQSWESFVAANVFKPLGFTATDIGDDAQKTKDYAFPHGFDLLKGYVTIPFFKNIASVGPAGAINANAVDMGRYLQFQVGDGKAGDTTLVSPEELKLMHTGFIDMSTGAEGQLLQQLMLGTNHSYAMGWWSEKYRDVNIVSHDGSIDGFMSSASLAPDQKAGVFLMVNIGNATSFLEVTRLGLLERLLNLKLTDNIAEVLNKRMRDSSNPTLRLLDPVTARADWDKAKTYKANPADYEPMLGDFTSPVGKITLYKEGDQIRLKVESKPPQDLPLVPISADTFLTNLPQVPPIHISIKKQSDGSFSIYQEGTEIGKRVPSGATTTEYKDPKGRFTAQIPATMLAQPVGELLTLRSTNPAAAFFLTATKATDDRLDVQIKAWLKTLDPTFDLDPKSSADKVAGDVKWTLYRYALPNDQLLFVGAVSVKGTLYLAGSQGQSANATAMGDTLSQLIDGIKITQ